MSFFRAPLKIQVSKQDKARVKNLSAAYSWYVSDNFFRVTPYCDETWIFRGALYWDMVQVSEDAEKYRILCNATIRAITTEQAVSMTTTRH